MENMGLVSHHQLLSTVVILDYRWLMSDENVTVTETTFNGVPVCLYLPKRKSDSRRPAVIFIHGGATVMGSYSKYVLYKQEFVTVCRMKHTYNQIFCASKCIQTWQNFYWYDFLLVCAYIDNI